jgi:hypothetical protein
MIRCIPVDGSVPFEVENDTRVSTVHGGVNSTPFGLTWAIVDDYEEDRVPCMVGDVLCRIESWRERAERLEKELAELRRQSALDAMDKRRESEHG